jgi:hypothetical protein
MHRGPKSRPPTANHVRDPRLQNTPALPLTSARRKNSFADSSARSPLPSSRLPPAKRQSARHRAAHTCPLSRIKGGRSWQVPDRQKVTLPPDTGGQTPRRAAPRRVARARRPSARGTRDNNCRAARARRRRPFSRAHALKYTRAHTRTRTHAHARAHVLTRTQARVASEHARTHATSHIRTHSDPSPLLLPRRPPRWRTLWPRRTATWRR